MSFIISVYGVMGVAAIILYVFYGFDSQFDVQLQPSAYLSACLFIVFYGLAAFTDRQNRRFLVDNAPLLRLLEVVQLLSSSVALLFFMPFVASGLTGSIAENRIASVDIAERLGSYGLLNTLSSLVGNLFPVSILLAFINLASIGRGGSRLRAHLLLVASSVYIVYVLAYVGRDGFVYWVFTFLFFYLFFKDYLPRVELNKLRFTAAAVALPALVAFVMITISRMFQYAPGDKEAPGMLGVFEYAGSQIFYFNDHYMTDAPPLMGLMNFGQFIELGLKLIGAPYEALDKVEWFRQFTDVGVLPWTFSTFIGAFLHDFGKRGTVVSVIILAALTRMALAKHARTGSLSFSRMLLVFLLLQVVLWGVFYYRQYSAGYYQIAVVLIALVFRASRTRADSLVIEKRPKGAP